MKVLLDTCVAVDILGKSSFFASSFASYDVALLGKFDVCLAISSTTDIAYLLHRRGFSSKSEARLMVAKLPDLFTLIDVTASDFSLAAQSPMKDFEDALIAYAAQRSGVDVIITRNKKDFELSPISALTPNEFLDMYKPKNYLYEEVELLGGLQEEKS